jgi:hypothetical protein
VIGEKGKGMLGWWGKGREETCGAGRCLPWFGALGCDARGRDAAGGRS